MTKEDNILIIDTSLLSGECIEFLQQKGIKATLLQLPVINDYVYGSSFIDRLENIFHRTILKNNNHIYTLINKSSKKQYNKELKKFLQSQDIFDYVLVMRPDSFGKHFFKTLRKSSKYCVGYMWDALNDYKYSELKKIRKFLDKIFVFEDNDLINYPGLNAMKGSNFYYEVPSLKKIEKENLISYIGNVTYERRDLLIDKLIPYLQSQNLKLNFNLVKNVDFDNTEIKNKRYINYYNKKKPYREHLIMMAKSLYSLDINPTYHKEYSFRVYESMYYETKLITTNKNILNFPLYKEENFFLIENEESLEKLPDFFNKKYSPYTENELSEHRFDNWLTNILKK